MKAKLKALGENSPVFNIIGRNTLRSKNYYLEGFESSFSANDLEIIEEKPEWKPKMFDEVKTPAKYLTQDVGYIAHIHNHGKFIIQWEDGTYSSYRPCNIGKYFTHTGRNLLDKPKPMPIGEMDLKEGDEVYVLVKVDCVDKEI